MTVGLIDWGIGGLSVYRELKKLRPKMNTIYISDSGATPYGKMSKDGLIQRLHILSSFLRSKNAKIIIIACNAASTVLDEIRTMNPDLKYYGMLDSGEQMIRQSKIKQCLIIGGKRTVASGFFQKQFQGDLIKIEVKAAQPLSAFIELGDMASAAFTKSLKKILSSNKRKPKAVLLACTHYPAIEKQIKEILPEAKVLDPGIFVIQKFLRENKLSQLNGKKMFFTTGPVAQMRNSANKAFKVRISKIHKLKL